MSLPEPPLWCRTILLILAIGSFLPQILRIQKRQTTRGVDSLYILWNLISTTEQLTIYIFLLITVYEPEGNVFLHSPPSAGDWFSLCHCAVATILFLTLFTQFLVYSDCRISLVASYTSFLLVSIIPLVLDAISPVDDEGREWLSVIFYALHSMLLYPIITALGVLSVYRQAREIFAVTFPNALSLHGLGVQAVVFTLVSVAWIWSLPFPYEMLNGKVNWNIISAWYGMIGWVIVNSFVFALGQAVLLVLALHRSSSDKVTIQGGEIEPLLGQRGEE